MSSSVEEQRQWPPFNPDNYRLGEDDSEVDKEALEFFKRATRIDDEEELKRHIVETSRRAYEDGYQYTCICVCWAQLRLWSWELTVSLGIFGHTNLRMRRHAAYPLALAQAREGSPQYREEHVFVDVGTCFGADVRKLAVDGWDARRVFAVDLRRGMCSLLFFFSFLLLNNAD
jgi:hypothetical protein